jgi:hypothetical protein
MYFKRRGMSVETLLSHAKPQIQTRSGVTAYVNSELDGDQLHIKFDVVGHPAGGFLAAQKFAANITRTDFAESASHNNSLEVRVTMAPGVNWPQIRESVLELTAQTFGVTKESVEAPAMLSITSFKRF